MKLPKVYWNGDYYGLTAIAYIKQISRPLLLKNYMVHKDILRAIRETPNMDPLLRCIRTMDKEASNRRNRKR